MNNVSHISRPTWIRASLIEAACCGAREPGLSAFQPTKVSETFSEKTIFATWLRSLVGISRHLAARQILCNVHPNDLLIVDDILMMGYVDLNGNNYGTAFLYSLKYNPLCYG